MPDAPEPKTERLGERYALYGEIASGGMATVHFGRLRGPVGFARTVAIKRLHSQYASEPDFVSMFVDEARLAARVRHPNVVATIDVVASENLLYLVMEYVQGESLAKLARACVAQGGRVPRRIATAIMLNMLQGLHAAHEAKNEKGEPLGIVHRDVSPQNVLVGTDGVARVIDFGIAKAASRASVATETGQMKGKPAYMSPEQILDKSVTRLADIYAASVVYWELLTGERLFLGKNDVETINRVLKHPVEPPSSKLPSLLPALDQIVLRGLERDPTKRYATAREMARAIEECIAPASSSDVGEWVEKLAGEVLATRERRLKEIEDRTSFGPPADDAETTIGPPPALIDTLIGARTRAPMRRDPNLADTLDHALAETQDENPIDARNRRLAQTQNNNLAQTQRQNPVRPIATVPNITPAYLADTQAPGPPTLSAPSTEVSTPLGQTLPAPRPMAFPDLDVRTGRADADRLSIPTPGNLELPPTGRHLLDDDDDDDDMDPEAETRVQPSFELDLGPQGVDRTFRGLPHTSTQSTQGVANTVEVAAEARPARRPKGWLALPLVLLLFACAGVGVYKLPGYVRGRCIAAAARQGIVLGVQTVTLHPHGIVLGGVKATVPDLPFVSASASELEVALSGLTPQGVSARGFELAVTGPLANVAERTATWRAAHEGVQPGGPLTLLAQSGHVVWGGIFGEGTQLEVWDASVSLSSDGPRDLRLVASSLMVHTPRANLGPWSAKLARDATASRLDVALDPSVPEWATLQATSNADGKGTVGLVVPKSSLARIGLPPELLGPGSDASTQIEARLDVAARPRTEGRGTVSLYGVHTSRGVADAKLDVAMTGEVDPWTAIGTLTVGASRGRVTGTVARPGPGFRLQLVWKPSTAPCDAEPVQDVPPDDHGFVSPAPPSPRRRGRGAPANNPSPPPFQPAPAFVGGPGAVTITLDARDVGGLAAIPSSPHCLLGVLPLP